MDPAAATRRFPRGKLGFGAPSRPIIVALLPRGGRPAFPGHVSWLDPDAVRLIRSCTLSGSGGIAPERD